MSAVFRALEGPPSRPSKVGPVANGGTSQQIVLRRATRRPVSKKWGRSAEPYWSGLRLGHALGEMLAIASYRLNCLLRLTAISGTPRYLNHFRSAKHVRRCAALSDVLPVVGPKQGSRKPVWGRGIQVGEGGSPRLLVAVFSLAILPQTVWRRGGTSNDRFRRIERH